MHGVKLYGRTEVVCSKFCYPDRRSAERAMRATRAKGASRTKPRAYLCDVCDAWHWGHIGERPSRPREFRPAALAEGEM